uniref:Secreted protein n=1 Tax=Parascaris equorum TaxID=6256 RepID=A0A914RW71_PAREQ
MVVRYGRHPRLIALRFLMLSLANEESYAAHCKASHSNYVNRIETRYTPIIYFKACKAAASRSASVSAMTIHRSVSGRCQSGYSTLHSL